MGMFGKSRAPNIYAQPTAQAYKPTVRDNMARAALNLFGDTHGNQQIARNIFGSSGLGYSPANPLGMSLADLTPLGLAFAADEAGRQAGQGHPFKAAGNLALQMVPVPGVAKGAKGMIGKAAKAVERRVPLPDGIPTVSLPTRSSLRTPLVPTAEQMARFGIVERVPLSKVEAHEPNSARRWDRFSKGDSPGAVVDGYGDLPLAVRQESGEYILYDGHHRTQRALSQGADGLDMHVIDARTYDPENAGRASRPTSPQEISALLRELGLK